jgi:3-oxoacyl-[acyl-carrier-protein] synthase-3
MSVGIQLTGLGAYVPANILRNEDMTRLVDTSDEWIVSRTGIRSRRVVAGDEGVVEMAIYAAHDALASGGLQGEDIDLILVATSTSECVYPMVSCRVQQAIGAHRAAGFDLVAACTGFVNAMVVAKQFLMTGAAKNVLVVGSDVHSRVTDWTDRNTCILFGDGAGACVLSAVPASQNRVFHSDMHMDGGKGHYLTLGTAHQNAPLVAPRSAINPLVYMNGREVFKFAVGTVPLSIRTTVTGSGWTLADVDYLVLHQANSRIMDAMAEKLSLPMARLLVSMADYGNTSAASIPIAINDAMLDGRMRPGQKIVMCGFGAGLSWASIALEWSLADKRQAAHCNTLTRSETLRKTVPLAAATDVCEGDRNHDAGASHAHPRQLVACGGG